MSASASRTRDAGQGALIITPWGDASQLRARRLPPGLGSSPVQTERNQRERLFAATAATVSAIGYADTTVADLIDLSGISRKSFYQLFSDKQHCFLAAVDALLGPALEGVVDEARLIGDRDRSRQAFEALIELIASQPAAARMCLVEIYAAGPEAVALLDRALEGVERLAQRMFDQIPGREGMPAEIVRAMIGGVQKVLYKRLLRGEEAELAALAPELWEWVLSVPPPPGPLAPRARRSVRPARFEDRQKLSNPVERVLRAMAAVVSEKGYQEVTVAEVVARARTSRRTFYEYFGDKDEAIAAAVDSGSAQMLAAALPAFRRAEDWQHSVHDTQEAMFRFASEEPEFGRLGAVEMYGAGRLALEQREAVSEGMEGLLAVGYELAPDAPPIAPEAIGGALYALLYDFVKANGPGRLLELVPTAVYVTLAPFLSAEEAHEVALG